MVIRNRYLAFIYRLALLAFSFYALYLAFKYLGALNENRSFFALAYFGTDALLLAVVVLLAEVIANLIGLKNGPDGIAPGVWSPLFVGVMVMLLFDTIAHPIMARLDGTSFFTADNLLYVSISKIAFPLLYMLDYLLFGEKGTVKWKHGFFWGFFPVFYFAFIMLTHFTWNATFFPYSFLSRETFADQPSFLANIGGWAGVWFVSVSFYLGFLALSYLTIFMNNLYAGAYRRSSL